ncbi:hypothetical protein V7426_21880 [Bacillus thuringiensis]|uniref:hypothetical protein n=1 Tax=Bacillus thuringiensis TaxID=1428 RepID=UPI000BF8A728|nr:hypothetical protein [Bacillus thuringiensis]PFD89240.1 hypothetical protein CN306_18920 [Bacillus thuringiensis]PFS55842.1 hypothetical protein COK64_22970 [Bacillus thuringiensis]
MDINERITRLENAMSIFGWPDVPNVPQVPYIPPTEMEIDFENITIGERQDGDYYVIYGETNDYRWAWVYVGVIQRFKRIRLTFKNVRGHGVVSGCCTEWNVTRPKIGSAQFFTDCVERDQYSVRVTGYHNWPDGALPMALGFFAVNN